VPEQQAPSAAEPKGVIVLAVGLPGSGKSAWFARQGIVPLSTDLIRKLLLDDETDQSQQAHVFGTLFSLLRRRLAIGRKITYVDATNLSPAERSSFFRIARDFGCAVEAIFFDVPPEVCAERNAARSRVVPPEVMEAFARKLRPPSYEEGFRKITVVDAAGRARVLPRKRIHRG
jgi:predicted kinase